MSIAVFRKTRALAANGPKPEESPEDFVKRLFLTMEADAKEEQDARAEFDRLGEEQRAGSFEPYDIDVQVVDISPERITEFTSTVMRLLVEAETAARRKALATANALAALVVAGISGGITAPVAIKAVADLGGAWA